MTTLLFQVNNPVILNTRSDEDILIKKKTDKSLYYNVNMRI